MVKLKRNPKNLELDISVARIGNYAFFHSKQQLHDKRRIARHGVKICVLRNTAGPINVHVVEMLYTAEQW